MKKKTYYIAIGGEFNGSCLRELSQSEFELISGIFKECNSAYTGGRIEEVPSMVEFLNYLTRENLHSYDYEEIIKISKHFNLSNTTTETLISKYINHIN